MTKKEFIVETDRGSLYHLTYKKGFFSHGSRFTFKQLVGKTRDFGPDNRKVVNFVASGLGVDRSSELDLHDLKVGTGILMEHSRGVIRTGDIAKIFERIH